MANQTVGLNVQDANPYNMVVTASGTLISRDIELVVNLTTVTSKQQVLTALDQLKLFYEQSLGAGAETMSAAPP